MNRRPVAAALVSLSTFAIVSSAARAQYDLDGARGYASGADALALAVADFDEDGRSDLLVPGGTGLFLHLIRDDHALAVDTRSIPVPGTIEALAAGDIDGDGHADVAVAITIGGVTGRVGVLFGDGRGAFTGAGVARTIGPVSSLALLDANADGRLDVAFSDLGGPSVGLAVQRATPPRRFAPAVEALVGGSPIHLASGDFNGDGRADLAAAVTSLTAFALLDGDGAGGFAALRTISSPQRPIAIATADFDGDGLTDVVSTGFHVFVLMGDPLLGLVAGWKRLQGLTYLKVAAADFDGDSSPDIVACGYSGRAVWSNDGAGDFGVEPRYLGGDGACLAFMATDFDGDGAADVLGTHADATGAWAVLGAGAGAFVRPEFLVAPSAYVGAAGDFNADGFVDLVIPSGLSLAIHFGNGVGGFHPDGLANMVMRPTHVRVAEMNGDGAPDLLVAHSLNASVTLLQGGGGAFVARGVLATAATPVASADGDFDGDGIRDFATADRDGGGVSVFFGSGGFAFSSTFVATAGSPRWIESADLDADGYDDLVVSRAEPEGLHVLFGASNRGFAPATFPTGGVSPAGVGVGDVDGDGRLDAVLGDAGAAVVSLLVGDGARGFRAPATHAMPAPVVHVALADVSGDGFLDVLASHGPARQVSILLGDALGGFEPRPLTFDAEGNASCAIPLDVAPADGALEIAVPGHFTAWTALFRFRETPVSSCLRGSVNAGQSPARDVLTVNGRTGGLARRVFVPVGTAISAFMAPPPATVIPPGTAPFAAYAWPGAPGFKTVRALPGGLGTIAFPMPLAPLGSPQPIAIWNNVGRPDLLGQPTLPSTPAPSALFTLPQGLAAPATFTIQGVIPDTGSPSGRAAVTNGIIVEVR